MNIHDFLTSRHKISPYGLPSNKNQLITVFFIKHFYCYNSLYLTRDFFLDEAFSII